MNSGRLRVLLIIEQCNPEWPSVPLVGFHYYSALNRLADVTLVTHGRNQQALAKVAGTAQIAFMPESSAVRRYYQAVARITSHGGRINWPILHALSYPVYAEFNRQVFRCFGAAVSSGAYDVVHAFSPIIPRYPVKIIDACRNTPFVLGPVNGGLPFPRAFKDIARSEFDQFSFLRVLSRLLPGYAKTYRRADKVLAGSTPTLSMLRRSFAIEDDRIELFHENGLTGEFFGDPVPGGQNDLLRLLFVGRLVRLKCADVVIEAMGRLAETIKRRTSLTIVGDGPERQNLQEQARNLGLANRVSFAGWVSHDQTREFYHQADIFCFPSIREFGGAVVLEAMAAGLPCIVTDYGGIAEYVTDGTGFKIAPRSRTHLIDEMVRSIEMLGGDEGLHSRMSACAVERARAFEWDRKASFTVAMYRDLIHKRSSAKDLSPA